MANDDKIENRVLLENSEDSKKIKALILNKTDEELLVETPTGYRLDLRRTKKKGPYKYQLGTVQFYSDGLTYP